MYIFNVFSNGASKVTDKHSCIIQQIVSPSLYFSIWGLILVPLGPASSLNLTEIPSLKIVPKSASSLFGLLKEMYETEGFPLSGFNRDVVKGTKAVCPTCERKKHQQLGIRHLMEPGLPSHITSAYCFYQ